MTKRIFVPLAVLTAFIIAMSLAKGVSLAPIGATFPQGEAAEIMEIAAQDWEKSQDEASAYYTIPEDVSDAQVMELTDNWTSFEVYLDNTLLYSFNDEYQELGRAFHWIEIPEGSGGKRIILTSSSAAAIEKIIQADNCIGTDDAVRCHFFAKNLPVLLLAVIDAMMAVVVILILAVLWRKLSVGLVRGMWDLLFFIILNGIWLISDCGFPECFTAKTGLWALISYMAFMLMPVFTVRFAQRLLTYRRNSLCILGAASLSFTSATLVLYLTRVAPLSTLLVFHQALTVVDYIAVFFLCNYELRHYRVKRLEAVRNGVVLMGAFVISAILAYWKGMNTLYPLLFGVGFTCYIICLTISVVQQAYNNLGKKAKMDTYRKLAYKDVMTALYNRSAFMEYQKGVGSNVRQSAYILFDVNGLKIVNDTRGHQAGDGLIMQAAACIRETFEGIGNCYRIGGDEFMVVLCNIRDKAEVQSLLERFENQVWTSNRQLENGMPPLSIAYGYSLAGEEPRTAEEMYEEADEWMYDKKRSMKATG